MKRILIVSIIVSTLGLLGHASAANFAAAVIDYTPGTGVGSYTDPNAALGQPGDIVGPGSGFDGVFSPFNPHYETTELTGIGAGGQLTLQLQTHVTVQPGAFEIGVWSNVGIYDTDYPNGQAGSPATTLSPTNSAIVSVSADGTNWVTLNSGAAITFSLPGNYYTNAGPYDSTAPSNPQYADFGKPFTGTLSDFDGEDNSQAVATLNGSAGGTWLDLDGTGLSQVDYIRFNGVPDNEVLYVNGVSGNESLPEPNVGILMVAGAILALGSRRSRSGLAGVTSLAER